MAKVLRIDRKLPETWEDALRDFLFWKQAQGVRSTTLEDYRRHVAQFFRRFPQAYDQRHLKRCVLEYMADRVKPATYNIRLAYLKGFFKWCVSSRRTR